MQQSPPSIQEPSMSHPLFEKHRIKLESALKAIQRRCHV
jgi:hypothetical protein